MTPTAIQRALEKVGLANHIRRIPVGDEALDYLFRRGAYAPPDEAPRPALILLDLDLPGTDGREVLVRLKADPDLAAIPVVVISISVNPHDVRHCNANGAAGYVITRPGFVGFLEAAKTIKDYWFDVVAPPGQRSRRHRSATAQARRPTQ